MKKSLAVVAAMIDDLAPVAARISKSLKSHKVVVSTDRVLDDLNTLVTEYADGKEVRASARAFDADAGAELPPYNIAADMISTAFALFEQGDTRRALQQMVVAFESEGMPELAQALVAMNDESQGEADEDHTVTAGDASDDEDDNDDADAGGGDTSDDEDDEDDDDGTEDEDDADDWEDPDADGDTTTDAGVVEGVISEMTEPPSMDLPDDEDDDDGEDESVLLSRFRNVSASDGGKSNVALANAMSLTGMPPARRVAKRLLD